MMLVCTALFNVNSSFISESAVFGSSNVPSKFLRRKITMSMKPSLQKLLDRRSFFKSTSTTAAGISLASCFNSSEDVEAATQNVIKASKPSELKITDLRVATLRGVPFTSPPIRIDTNQGIYGLG